MLQGQSHPIRVLLVSPRPNLTRFYSMTNCFGVNANFERSIPNASPNWPLENTKCKMYPTLLPLSPKFQSVLLYGQPLSSYRLFWDKCINMTRNIKRWKVPHMYLTTTHMGLKYQSVLLYGQPLVGHFEARAEIWTKLVRFQQPRWREQYRRWLCMLHRIRYFSLTERDRVPIATQPPSPNKVYVIVLQEGWIYML